MLSKLRKIIFEGRFRRPAGLVYRGVIYGELGVQRALDAVFHRQSGRNARILQELTAVVKTFERPYTAQRLVDSIRRHYPQLRVVVVDDSRNPRAIPGVEMCILPYNSGVSAGRRAGLAEVTTKYVLILDDDYVFYRGTRLVTALSFMEQLPEIDIMGGCLVNLPFFHTIDYSTVSLLSTPALPVRPIGSRVGAFPVYDKVANFFIARTARLRLVNWDPQLKRVEHADFFTRARGVLTTVYNEDLRCLHAQTPFDLNYMKRRLDYQEDIVLLRQRYSAKP